MRFFQHAVSAGRNGSLAVRGNAVTCNVAAPETTRAPVPGALEHVVEKVQSSAMTMTRSSAERVSGAVLSGLRTMP